jgi:hypothetical protein
VALTVPTLIGTIYIHHVNGKKTAAEREQKLMINLSSNNKTNEKIPENTKTIAESFELKLWKGFSLQENFKAIISTEVSAGDLPSLNGMRGISVSSMQCLSTFNTMLRD